MCGRFSFVVSKEKIQQQLGEQIDTGINLRINYNVAPTQHAYVITNDKPLALQYFTWGLIPHWSNEGENSGKLINARMEGIEAKPSFRVPVRKRRCLVLADSFYEWKTEAGRKIPYRIALKNGDIMVMAGIWDVWYKDDYAIKSFTIITTPPNKEVAPLHNRMPVLLTDREEQQKWLKDLSLDEVLSMLHTPADDLLECYRVSEKVNAVNNNGPELHQRLADPPALF